MANVSLPAIVSQLPNDVRNFLQRVRELLVDIDTRVTSSTGGTTTTIIVGGGGSGSEPDYTQPPAPTGLTASGSITTIFLQWDDVSASYDNLSHTEIWRSSTNNLGTAVLNGTAQGHIYQDTVEPMSTYYYWVRMVSLANVDGPFNAVNGVAGVTSQDPASVVELLTAHGLYTDTPYYYQAEDATINGVVVPVGTYINNAYIANGSITTAKIGNAQITNAKINTITASKLTSGTITGQDITVGIGGNIKSGQTAYNTGTGWWIGKGVDGYSRFSVGNPTGAGFDWSEETGAMKFRGIMDLQSGSTIGGISADYIGGWASSLDNTKIDGVNIHADSSILTGSTAPEEGGRYSILSGGDLTFYDYIDSGWVPYKSVTKTVTGTCVDGETVNIGYFREQPTVLISPYNLQSYNAGFPNQSQFFKLSASNIRKVNNNWYFDTEATLTLSTGSVSIAGNSLQTINGGPIVTTTTGNGFNIYNWDEGGLGSLPLNPNESFDFTSSTVTLPSYTLSVTASVYIRRLWVTGGVDFQYLANISATVTLQIYTNETGWTNAASASLSDIRSASGVETLSFLTGSSSYNILYIRVAVTFNLSNPAAYITSGFDENYTQSVHITNCVCSLASAVIAATGQATYMAIG